LAASSVFAQTAEPESESGGGEEKKSRWGEVNHDQDDHDERWLPFDAIL
jgi:hypothetical protein